MPLPVLAAAGKVVIAAGEVFAIDAQDQRRPLQRRSDIFEGDTLVTGADGQLQLRFEDNAILALRADSQLRISEYHGASDAQPERVLMDLLGGGFRTISGSFGSSDRDAYQVRTPTASIGIRGTHYEAVYESDTLSVGVYEGGIVLTNDRGSLDLGLDSQFVFAQVQAGNLPQGLLNPPENLNVPNTPQTDEPGEESDEEGGEEGESDGNNDADLNDDSSDQTPGNNPGNAATDVGEFNFDDFNFSALEDALEEELANQEEEELVPGPVQLTEDEIAALTESSTLGILVMAPSSTGDNGEQISPNGPMFAYQSVAGDPQIPSPFMVAYTSQNNNELEDGYIQPNFVLRPGEDAYASSGAWGNAEDVNWAEWNLDGEVIATAQAGENSGFGSGTFSTTPFFYIEAEPTQAELSSPMLFSMNSLLTNFGVVPEPSGFMTVDFDDLNASGYFNFYGPGAEEPYWEIDFSGQINGTALTATLTENSGLTINLGQEGNETFGLDGDVSGIFTGGSGQSPVEFVGGFTAESIETDDEAYGIFVMEEDGNPQIPSPDQ